MYIAGQTVMTHHRCGTFGKFRQMYSVCAHVLAAMWHASDQPRRRKRLGGTGLSSHVTDLYRTPSVDSSSLQPTYSRSPPWPLASQRHRRPAVTPAWTLARLCAQTRSCRVVDFWKLRFLVCV